MTAEGAARTATSPRQDTIPVNPLRALVSPYTWLATLHLLTDLFVGVLGFPLMVTLLSLSAGLLVLALIGVPIFMAAAWIAVGLSAFERTRFAFFLGLEIPAPPLPVKPQGESFLRYARRLVTTPAVWRQIGYHLVHLPLGVVNFVVTSAAWAAPLFLMSVPTWYSAVPSKQADLWILKVTDMRTALFVAALGVLALVFLSPNIVRVLSQLDGAVARALLGRWSSGELTQRVGELEVTRRRAVDVAEAERRRIERDLHDGAQQRLTSLAMTLGRAQVRLGDDAAGADPAVRALIDDAHREAKEAILELRDLTRGIHPPVLTDRGLDAALSALAARSPVPVSLAVNVAERPSRTIEAIAYFVVAEALTNIAKHSHARAAHVLVERLDGHLRLVISDDGVGGASATTGSGLAGLADRVAAVDGTLQVRSPAGGPTAITVELPCR